jgi:hypothetical protein
MKGFKKCCISSAVMIGCGMAVNRVGRLGERVRKMKALTVKLETVTLNGKGRWNRHDLCIKCFQLIVKYFFLADTLFWAVVLDLDQYILLWQMFFMSGVILD